MYDRSKCLKKSVVKRSYRSVKDEDWYRWGYAWFEESFAIISKVLRMCKCFFIPETIGRMLFIRTNNGIHVIKLRNCDRAVEKMSFC